MIPQTTESGRFWCRVTNACGSVDSDDAAITVVAPLEIASVAVKGTGAKARIIATGSSIPSDVQVFVSAPGIGIGFEKPAKVSGETKLTQRGRTDDGRTIDEVVPRGATRTLIFVSSRGNLNYDYSRP